MTLPSAPDASTPAHRSDRPRICFCIPASPDDGFFSQLALFRLSLDTLGDIYRDAHLFVTLGGREPVTTPERWSSSLARNTSVRHVGADLFDRYGPFAQGNARLLHDYDGFDAVIFCDADTLFVRPIDDLLSESRAEPAVAGVIAHYPFPHDDGEDVEALWHALARAHAGRPIRLDHHHTLVPYRDRAGFPRCPFYVNHGFVLLKPAVIRTIAASYLEIRDRLLGQAKNPRFTGQMALTLALLRHEVPTRAVGMRFNFPNDPVADRLHPEELADVRMLHYLRTERFDRSAILTTPANFASFLTLPLTGSDLLLQRHVRRITGGHYPFPASPEAVKPA
jgi:hypothetical protein